jgi:RHS repeat-associated protein
MRAQSSVLRWVLCGCLAGLLAPTAASAQGPGEAVEFYHHDAIGSVRLITDEAGAIVAKYDYLPFGDLWVPTMQEGSSPRKFVDKERDSETGFDYSQARYYSNLTGRFTTVDPVLDIEAALIDPQRWNRYGYALNNPLKFTDPDGRNPVLVARLLELAQRVANSPAAQRAATWAQTQGTAAWNWATRFFNSPAGQETVQTIGELASGAQAPSAPSPSALVGRAREEFVAKLVGGRVAGDVKVTLANVGSTAIDVFGPGGEYIGVGGAAKLANLAQFGSQLKVLRASAEAAGQKALYYFEQGTPKEVIRLAEKWLGKENVILFERK